MPDYEYGEVTGTFLEVDTKPGGVTFKLNATPLELLDIAYSIASKYDNQGTPPNVLRQTAIWDFANALISTLKAENNVPPVG